MAHYIIYWLIIGFVSGIIGTVIDYYKGVSITVNHMVWLIGWAILGIITTFVLLAILLETGGKTVLFKRNLK